MKKGNYARCKQERIFLCLHILLLIFSLCSLTNQAEGQLPAWDVPSWTVRGYFENIDIPIGNLGNVKTVIDPLLTDALLQGVTSRNPWPPQTPLSLSKVYFHYFRSISIARALDKLCQSDSPTRSNAIQKAIFEVNLAIKSAYNHSEFHVLKGVLLAEKLGLAKGDCYTEALDQHVKMVLNEFTSALEVDVKSDVARLLRAEMLIFCRDFQHALADLKRVSPKSYLYCRAKKIASFLTRWVLKNAK